MIVVTGAAGQLGHQAIAVLPISSGEISRQSGKTIGYVNLAEAE